MRCHKWRVREKREKKKTHGKILKNTRKRSVWILFDRVRCSMMTDIAINMRVTHRSQTRKNKLSLKVRLHTVGFITQTKFTTKQKKLYQLGMRLGEQRKVPFAFEHGLISKFNLIRLIPLFSMIYLEMRSTGFNSST